jgi:predicted RNA polymerase sigma factor
VGLIALAAAAIRFGPIRPPAGRKRRSPLEHVRALATALAAARGHDLAVRLMAQGLRRRLSRGPQAGLRADPRPWLAALAPHLRSGRGREAAAELLALTGRPQDADGVLHAANVVEDVWEDLKP